MDKLTKADAEIALDGHGLSIVRRNLLTREGYSPYCGGDNACRFSMPRTFFDGAASTSPSSSPQFLARWPSRAALSGARQ